MPEDELRKLFDKLRGVQKEIDARFDSPEIMSLATIDALINKEHMVIHAIVLATNLPEAVERLKVASAAAQRAHVEYHAGQCTLEARNAAVREAIDRRDDMIGVLNRNLQYDLREYNDMLREKKEELVVEFGLHEASSLCSAS